MAELFVETPALKVDPLSFPLCFNALSIWTTAGTCLTPAVLLLPKYKFPECLR